jgi:hypothetical protein
MMRRNFPSLFPFLQKERRSSTGRNSSRRVQTNICLSFTICSLLLSGCGAYLVRNPSVAQLTSTSVSISPGTAQITAGQSLEFAATVSGNSNKLVTWAVNGLIGGSLATGIISSSGLYLTPSPVPAGASVTVTATSVADASQSATATVTIQNTVTVSPSSVTLALGTTQQLTATVNGIASIQVVWMVGGIPGGSAASGTISASGIYTAPALVPGSAVTVAAVDASDSLAYATATLSIVDPAVAGAHDQWLSGVAEAAASYGCTDVSVQQEETESIPDVIDRFGQSASEGSCLVLWPISTDPTVTLYSLAWGGTIDGKDIFYISDISQMRIWNSIEATGN